MGFSLSDSRFSKIQSELYVSVSNSQLSGIVIEILYGLEDYYISFDNGQNFVRVEESELGFQHNRDELKWRLKEYQCAHPVDRQRGDAKPPLSYFVDFLDNFIK